MRDPSDRSTEGRVVVRDVPVRGVAIRLGQLLKLADLVETGADAKALLTDGRVEVNGEVEQRRGRQLSPGDVVRVDDRAARVV
jgi:ribosome-associated protein